MLRFEATFEETLGDRRRARRRAGRAQPRRGDGLHLVRRAAPGRAAAAGRGAQHRLRLGRPHDRRVSQAVATMRAMHRSLVTVDLAAIRHNVGVLRGRLEARRALGRRQGGRLRARRRRRGAGRARGGRDRARRRHARRGARAARRAPRRAGASCSGRPGRTRSQQRATRGSSSASRQAPRRSRGVAVHLKLDTGMGRWGLSELAAAGLGCRRADEPLRLGRHRPGIHRGAARAVPRRDRAVRAPDAPHREQRRHAASPCIAPRCRPLRDRDLRHLAVRHRPRSRRPAAGAALGVRRRARQDARAGREHRLRPPLRRDRRRPGSGSCRSATRTGSGAT